LRFKCPDCMLLFRRKCWQRYRSSRRHSNPRYSSNNWSAKTFVYFCLVAVCLFLGLTLGGRNKKKALLCHNFLSDLNLSSCPEKCPSVAFSIFSLFAPFPCDLFCQFRSIVNIFVLVCLSVCLCFFCLGDIHGLPCCVRNDLRIEAWKPQTRNKVR